MPRSFDLSADYDGSVEAVHRAFTDETYWRARLAGSGVDVAVLESIRVGGDTVEVVTVQVIHSHKLPGMVTQLHVGDLRIRREETWGPVADGAAQGSVVGSILDAPVNLTGTAMLSPIHETGCPAQLSGHRPGTRPDHRRQAGEHHRRPAGRAGGGGTTVHRGVDRRNRVTRRA